MGYNEDGYIKDCVNEGEIIGNYRIGGIAGQNDGFEGHSYIERCINLGNIKGNKTVGGIVGENHRTASIINCENIGHITGNMYAGGIVGYVAVLEKDKKEIKYCINIGKIECDSYGNAIVGALSAWSTECTINLENCYYLGTSAKDGYEEYDRKGTYKISEIRALSTLEQLVQQETYKDFDFINVWKISKYYPIVQKLNFDESLLEKPNVHQHSYDIWKYDETGHWKECLCGDKTEKQQHILEIKNQKKPTCTEEGYSGNQYCKDCGIKVKSGSKLKALGHTWDNGTVTKEATCDENGKKVRECITCGETDTEVIEALGHNEVIDAEIPATCTEEGKTEGSHCERCGKVLRKQESIPTTDHKWSDWKVIKKPTCTDKGSKTRNCNDCGVTENVDIKATGHAWENKYTVDKEATCTTDGSKSIHCSVCGISKNSMVIPATGHSYGKWESVQEAIVFVNGIEKRKCLKCNDVQERTIAKLKPTIKISKTNVKIKVKKSVRIKVSNLAKGDSVQSWKTSSKKVATVSKTGKIKAKKKGKATITVVLKSGKTAKIKVTVKRK